MKLILVTIFLMQMTVLALFATTLTSAEKQTLASTPPAILPVKVRDAKVDYNKLEKIIDKKVSEKVSEIPVPKDGVNGVNGKDGADGKIPPRPKDGKQGPKGDPGVAVQKVEFRSHPITRETEWRCSGDILWTSLIFTPVLKDSCL